MLFCASPPQMCMCSTESGSSGLYQNLGRSRSACILLVLFLAHPKHVVLNRGNHEDFPICCAYGFQQEVYHKYDELTFGMFCELFRHLPLFAVINDSILVLHGGLFHSQAKLAELDDLGKKT